MSERVNPAEQYNSNYYQRTVEIERPCIQDCTADELYEAETDYAFAMANVNLTEGDHVLDLASGTAKHMAKMRGRLPGVYIEGVEKGEKLAEIANNQTLKGIQEDTRAKLVVHVGDMADIPAALPNPNTKYKLITCLGYSFCYLNKQQREQAFRQMCSLLEPGGKIVIQSREVDLQLRAESGRENAITSIQKRGEECWLLADEQQGDGYYLYGGDTPHPDPSNPDDYEEIAGDDGRRRYREKATGIPYNTFGRAYIPNLQNMNDEHDLGLATTNDFGHEKYKDKAIEEIQVAGFADVRFEKSKEHFGDHRLTCLVATKPYAVYDSTPITDQSVFRSIEYWRE